MSNNGFQSTLLAISCLFLECAYSQEETVVWDWDPVVPVYSGHKLLNGFSSAQLGNKVIVANIEGLVYSSTDLDEWTLEFAPVYGPVVKVVEHNGILLASCSSGVYYSRDGVRWSYRSLTQYARPTSQSAGFEWMRFVNDWFIIDLEDGSYRVSKDFSDWKSISAVPEEDSNNLIGAFGETLVALGSSIGDHYFMLDSEDQWMARSLPRSGELRGIGQHRGIYYMWINAGEFSYFYSSSDLESWTEVTKPADDPREPRTIESVLFAGDLVVLKMSDKVDYLSIDGLNTWHSWRDQPSDNSNPTLQNVMYQNGIYTGLEGKTGNYWVMQSLDGLDWYNSADGFAGTTNPDGLRWTDNGYVLSGKNIGVGIGWGILTSYDFDHWVHLPGDWDFEYGIVDLAIGTDGTLVGLEKDSIVIANVLTQDRGLLIEKPDWMGETIVGGNGVFLAMATNGEIARSENGVDWAFVNLPGDLGERSNVLFHEPTDMFFAGLASSTFYSSQDGWNWTQRVRSSAGNYNNARIVGRFLMVTSNSDYAISAGGVEWQFVGGVSGSLISYANGKYLRRDGYLSDNCLDWTEVELPEETAFQSLGSGWLGARGSFPNPDFVYSENGVDWLDVSGAPAFGFVKMIGDETYLYQGRNVYRFVRERASSIQIDAVTSDRALMTWTLPSETSGEIQVSSDLDNWISGNGIRAMGWRSGGRISITLNGEDASFFRLSVTEDPSE